MGINANGAKFLMHAHSKGVCFERTLTIGRQNLYLSTTEMRGLLDRFGFENIAETPEMLAKGEDGYCEPLLKFLGAVTTDSVDFSSYEKPTFTHDMNFPIPEQYKSRYTVILDGGSLEHIFNFPVAIRNCMEMLEIGGHYLAITPANNFFGHGFYQFSPELYYSVFEPANGFKVAQMIAIEDVADAPWYAVAKPQDVGGRVTLCNTRPVYLLVIAEKLAKMEVFKQPPQQSDYTVLWGGATPAAYTPTTPGQTQPGLVQVAKRLIPAAIRFYVRDSWNRCTRKAQVKGFDKRYFSRVSS